MLTESQIAALESRSKPYKVADAGGLHVYVAPSGLKAFRLKCRLAGREQLISLGRFPEVSLQEARAQASEAKACLKQGGKPVLRKHRGRKAADDPEPTLEPGNFIYFIQSACGHIKIGTSTDPEYRLRELQCGNPQPLKMLGIVCGGPRYERWLHRKFKASRVRGEWFLPCQDLLRLIRSKAVPCR